MTPPLIEIFQDGRVVTLQLNRPSARNALSVELCDAIVAGLVRVDRLADARVVVIAGAGPVFCAGADFEAVSGPKGVDFLPAFERMLETVAHCRLPTIARIQGAALGGGLQLATVCDFRVIANDAKLGIPSPKLGVVVNLENVERLVRLVGVGPAKKALMTGRTFIGAEALALGFATVTTAPEELDAGAEDLAGEIARLAPLSVQGAKRAIQVIVDHMGVRAHDPQAALAIDALVAEAYASEDLGEGIRALREKRLPNFKGC